MKRLQIYLSFKAAPGIAFHNVCSSWFQSLRTRGKKSVLSLLISLMRVSYRMRRYITVILTILITVLSWYHSGLPLQTFIMSPVVWWHWQIEMGSPGDQNPSLLSSEKNYQSSIQITYFESRTTLRKPQMIVEPPPLKKPWIRRFDVIHANSSGVPKLLIPHLFCLSVHIDQLQSVRSIHKVALSSNTQHLEVRITGLFRYDLNNGVHVSLQVLAC
jgi:hypothetical protein